MSPGDSGGVSVNSPQRRSPGGTARPPRPARSRCGSRRPPGLLPVSARPGPAVEPSRPHRQPCSRRKVQWGKGREEAK